MPQPLANVHGQLMPLDDVKISAQDRGFLFGDAVYEVLRVYHGQFWLFLKLTAPAVVLGYIAVFLGSPGGTRYYSIFREALSFSHISSCLRVSS